MFIEIFTNLYDECFPKVTTVKKKHMYIKPWLTTEIKHMCKKKYVLYRKYLKNPTCYRKNVYKQYRNKVNNSIRDAKRKYYDNKFKGVLNNARNTWKVINEILNKNKKKIVINEIDFEGQCVTNKTEMCNLFNNFFSTVGQKIHDNVHNPENKSFESFLQRNVVESLFFYPHYFYKCCFKI